MLRRGLLDFREGQRPPEQMKLCEGISEKADLWKFMKLNCPFTEKRILAVVFPRIELTVAQRKEMDCRGVG